MATALNTDNIWRKSYDGSLFQRSIATKDALGVGCLFGDPGQELSGY
jgi:hypothetical protein